MRGDKGKSALKFAGFYAARFLPAALILLMLAGCAPLTGRRRANLLPFAENTLAIAGDIRAGIAEVRPIYIHNHIQGPAVRQYQEEWDKARRIWRAIIAYSVEIVTISESRVSNSKKAQALADYIVDLREATAYEPWPEPHLSKEEFGEIIENVRARKKFLDALGAAQPIIDEVVHLIDYVSERLLDIELRAADEITASIEKEHAGLLEYTALLKEAKYSLFHNMVLLARYRDGDSTVLDEMFASDPSLLEVIGSRQHISTKDVQAIEKRLYDRVSAYELIQRQFDPDMELYQRQMRELEDLSRASTETISRIRIATIVWARTHRKMAAGITDPALIDVMGMAKKAIGIAMPIP